MSTFERLGLAITGVAMATTLVLPGRTTPQLATNVGNAVAKIYGVVTGQNRGV